MSIIEKGGVVPVHKRIVFLGDSITDDGRYIAHLDYFFKKHLPQHSIEFINLGVGSETASGLSEPDHPFPRPCVFDRVDKALELGKPDWVVVCYGMNDGIYYPFSEERMSAYQKGILGLIEKIHCAGAKAIVMTPPSFDSGSFNGELLGEGAEKYSYMQAFEGYSSVLKQYSDWIMKEVKGIADRVVDIYSPLVKTIEYERGKDPTYSSGDGINPDLKGHWVIARTLLGEMFHLYPEIEPDYLYGEGDSSTFALVMQRHTLLSSAWKEYVGHTNPNKAEALPIEEAAAAAEKLDMQISQAMESDKSWDIISDWNGYIKHDFYVNGRVGTYIEPKKAAVGKPWVWRMEFFFAFNYADLELLEKGWGLLYYRVCNLYGCPESVDAMKGFHDFVVERFGLCKTAALFGFSRGGLYAVNYAAKYPLDTGVVYIDAPVLNIRSWPGKGHGEWDDCLAVYGLDEESVKNFKDIPLNKAETLVKADIPVIIVAGDADKTVRFIENGKIFAEELERLGGRVKLIVKPGVDHHPHSLENPTEIVEFIINSTKASK